MFAQFFGSYLLNNKAVTPEQLSEAISKLKQARMKLGTLAMHQGLMTAAEVDEVCYLQSREDKRFGDRRGDELPEELAIREKRLAKIREAKQRLEAEAKNKAEEAEKKKRAAELKKKKQEEAPAAEEAVAEQVEEPVAEAEAPTALEHAETEISEAQAAEEIAAPEETPAPVEEVEQTEQAEQPTEPEQPLEETAEEEKSE